MYYLAVECVPTHLAPPPEAVSLGSALSQDEEQAAPVTARGMRVEAQLLRDAVHGAEPDARHLHQHRKGCQSGRKMEGRSMLALACVMRWTVYLSVYQTS